MDYCPGGEIFTYLRRARRFDEPTAQFYAAEIALIFEFLHQSEGVAYRDLKPENILLDASGHIKLVDFGFAKKVQGRKSRLDPYISRWRSDMKPESTWTLCGTPVCSPSLTVTLRKLTVCQEYLAPETIRNTGMSRLQRLFSKGDTPDTPTGHGCAVDWWAFGIFVFEMLVGQPPFWDQNPMKIYEQ